MSLWFKHCRCIFCTLIMASEEVISWNFPYLGPSVHDLSDVWWSLKLDSHIFHLRFIIFIMSPLRRLYFKVGNFSFRSLSSYLRSDKPEFALLLSSVLLVSFLYVSIFWGTTLSLHSQNVSLIRDNGRDQTQFYDKSPYTHQNTKKQHDNTKHHQNFDNTTISDRLRTVSWSNDSHQSGVV